MFFTPTSHLVTLSICYQFGVHWSKYNTYNDFDYADCSDDQADQIFTTYKPHL